MSSELVVCPPREELGSVSGTEGSSGRLLWSNEWRGAGVGPEAKYEQFIFFYYNQPKDIRSELHKNHGGEEHNNWNYVSNKSAHFADGTHLQPEKEQNLCHWSHQSKTQTKMHHKLCRHHSTVDNYWLDITKTESENKQKIFWCTDNLRTITLHSRC